MRFDPKKRSPLTYFPLLKYRSYQLPSFKKRSPLPNSHLSKSDRLSQLPSLKSDRHFPIPFLKKRSPLSNSLLSKSDHHSLTFKNAIAFLPFSLSKSDRLFPTPSFKRELQHFTVSHKLVKIRLWKYQFVYKLTLKFHFLSKND